MAAGARRTYGMEADKGDSAMRGEYKDCKYDMGSVGFIRMEYRDDDGRNWVHFVDLLHHSQVPNLWGVMLTNGTSKFFGPYSRSKAWYVYKEKIQEALDKGYHIDLACIGNTEIFPPPLDSTTDDGLTMLIDRIHAEFFRTSNKEEDATEVPPHSETAEYQMKKESVVQLPRRVIRS